MADIHIHRDHSLGLDGARAVARQWAAEAEARFDMVCTVLQGASSDTVEFTRSGVSGRLTVAADHFDLHARLGFLLGAFAKTIEHEITRNLDALLAAPPAALPGVAPKAAGKPATRPAARPAARPASKPAAKTAGKAAAKKVAR